ncbi:twin-arginine translocation pathway signal protein [Vibrio sp. 10N.261.55.A7]|uniref:Acg family FMN-binding oxidoreductase n=1 Tax=Vibrio sp. 10N.261.55.A7 TaxID=1880851 RepID=UPI000C8310FF|nr:twin-arginine translocation pathway signal protein [Vibrio sp. 10N.261.55.A7]PMJ90739.1 twin-arginine translocation pathway signal protein [Vibrio sp. 10N.261.55.A7]
MDRRQFIKVIGLGVGAATLSSAVVSYNGTSAPSDNFGWNGPDASLQDIRMKVLSYAILAPNAHNIQPWLVKMTGANRFDLYVDPQRLLPETDPIYRQIHISQGTFLETLSIAASGLGYEARMSYFPHGMYQNDELQDKPVASVELIKLDTPNLDPLFGHLLSRRSNKRNYGNTSLSQQEIESLSGYMTQHGQYPLTITQTKESKAKFETVLTDAMQIEVNDHKRSHETIAMFRFDQEELNQHRDGFGVAQAGTTGLKKIMAENFFLSREKTEQDSTSFDQQSVTMVQTAVASTEAFGWISTQGNSRLDQVIVGRDYCRLNLKTAAMGLAQHPMSQVLQEYSDMLPLQASFKKAFGIKESDTVQMLFRLGKADSTPHGPRRLVSDLLKA